MQVTPYNDTERSKKEQVEEMFDNIAPKYDFLNRLLSAGIDISWRKKAILFLASSKPKLILDVATGTGDFAFEALSLNPEKIIGYDISENMLSYGRIKAQKANVKIIDFIKGDSEMMPFEDNKFDAITVGFGVRNFENLEKGLREMQRVLKPGGKVAILEVSNPTRFPMKQFFSFYYKYILPTVGKMLSKDTHAYRYLPESVRAFPQGKALTQILENCGFKNCNWKPLTFGTCTLYTCEK
jgi:demethylmenaquinone methyltransferase/2-methoxy-6-polyprenyl-1,4-benzoquinol methylase